MTDGPDLDSLALWRHLELLDGRSLPPWIADVKVDRLKSRPGRTRLVVVVRSKPPVEVPSEFHDCLVAVEHSPDYRDHDDTPVTDGRYR